MSSLYSRNLSENELVESACRHWEARRQAAANRTDLCARPLNSFTIALSREVGTQGTLVAQEVSRQLGWQVYDHELLERIAQEMGIRTTLLESVDERQQSWLTESVGAFLSAHQHSASRTVVSEIAYVRRLVETVLALGLHGECVIVGRGAAFILPPKTTVRVRLVASIKERIAMLSHRLGINSKEAAQLVQKTDDERQRFVKQHFFRDAADPRNYDLILNTARFPIEAVAKMIIEALHRLQAKVTEIGEIIHSPKRQTRT